MTEPGELIDRLQTFVQEQTGNPTTVSELSRLPGGASRETWSFVATGSAGPTRLILRRDPPRRGSGGGRATEFELLRRAAQAGAAVPNVLWLGDAEALGGPGFVMEFVEGETIARKILRDDEFAPARKVLAAQCGEHLARIHSIDTTGLQGFEAPEGSPGHAELARYRSVYDSFGEPHPVFELAMRWLQRRPPRNERTTLVHGDFRNGNLIVGPEGIRAVLDWELSHVGDPWEDLGWLCVRSWRFGGAGEVGGFGDRTQLYEAYEQASGIPVDAEAVRWWEVFGNLKWGISCLVQAFTHLSGAVRSVELAAIGRRACETEYDLLELIREA